MKSKFSPPLWLLVVLVITSVAAGWIALTRHRYEARNKAVHFAVEISEARWVSAASKLTLTETLARLKKAGVTAVVLPEETFDDLLGSGRLVASHGDTPRFYCGDSALGRRLAILIQQRFGAVSDRRYGVLLRPSQKPTTLPLPMADLKPYGAGFNSEYAEIIKKAGLSLIVRVVNPPSGSSAMLRSMVKDAAATGAEGIIFSGDQVLGWHAGVETVADSLRASKMWYGSVEFGNQVGDTTMSERMLGSTLRVHSITSAELLRMPETTIVDRFVRAAAERNIRVFYLRSASPAGDLPIDRLSQIVAEVANGVRGEGLDAKRARPLEPFEIPGAATVAVGLGIAAVSIWLASKFLRGIALFAIGIAFLAVGASAGLGYGEKYVALLGALSFPTWATLCVLWREDETKSNGLLLPFLVACGISFVGGLHVAGMLTALPFMLKVEQFVGVKAAHAIPPLIVGTALLLRATPARDAMIGVVRWLHLTVFAAVSAALLFVLIRTGNDAPSSVGSFELWLRNMMDAWLPERPRTKELFVGHPALILSVGLLQNGARAFLPLTALLAALGQASVVNTFCHLHTPIEVTVVRVATGVVTGGILGLILWLAVRRFFKGPREQSL